ncbi:ASCH domain-containing protein [Xylocopilactobacillus apis]|uniref:RNA-binding protein n=1 Tax=Xylocopilactobacillus apis TaxID=2932183 RepID=A0AAU9CTA0_9LACO|nr:ASCH domain-containing protein [Xylocopilactobacillus apis]BDR57232.1 RNA-binding protein [Xylocopilactobacillus apis]
MNEIEKYWQVFADKNKLTNAAYEAWAFGDNPKTADELAKLVLEGKKTATSSRFVKGDKLPQVGEYNIILDGQGHPVCITQTLSVEIMPFKNVSAEHAYLEGEDDRTLASWRNVHRDFFTRECLDEGKTFTEEIPCVCEVFKAIRDNA